MGCDSEISAHTLPVHKGSWDLPWSWCWWVGRAQPGVHALASLSYGLWAVAWYWFGLVPHECLFFSGMSDIYMAMFPNSLLLGFLQTGVTGCQSSQPLTLSCFSSISGVLLSFLMHSLHKDSSHSLLVCTAMCAIACHTQPCALGHGSLYLAFDQGKVMILLWAVSIPKLWQWSSICNTYLLLQVFSYCACLKPSKIPWFGKITYFSTGVQCI